MLLAYYVANPSASHGSVVQTLGISSSGLKKLRRGLLDKHVLVEIGGAYTIRLPGLVLVRDSHGGHFVCESEAVKSGYKIAHPAPKLAPAKDVYRHWESSLKQMCRQPDTTPSYLLSATTNAIKRIEAESPEGAEREAALLKMKKAENVFFARAVLDEIVKKCEAKALEWVGNATPEQLVTFRQKVEGKILAGMPEPKLLGMVTKVISQ